MELFKLIKGDKGNYYCIVVHGKVAGFFKRQDSLISKYFNEYHEIFVKGSNESFGDVAIMSNAKR